MTLPELSSLRLLVDVARLGSIGAAGRANQMTQQSASQRLRSMEAQVGLTLLRRSPTGAGLTEAGVLLVGWAERLLDLGAEVEQALSTLHEARDQAVSVIASMTVAEHLVPSWLVRLRHDHSTTARLTAANSVAVRAAVQSGAADLGFVEDGQDHGGLASMLVGRDTLVLVASPDDRWAHRTPATDQIAARSLTWRETGSGTRRVAEQALTSRGLEVAVPAVELTTTSAVRAALLAGSPPSFVTRRAVGGDLDAGRLVEIPTDLNLERPLEAVWVGSGRPPAGPVRDLLAIATADGARP